jgi:hypothetical protein
MSRAFNPQLIYNGDPITLSYTVVNTGKRPVSEIALKDDKAGAAAYSSGDTNTNKAIDPGETWLFKANYTVPTTQMGPLQTNAEVIGKDSDGQPVNCAASTSINITQFHLTLNPPSQAEVINSITMTGSVNDPTVKEVTLDHNGRLRQVPVVDGVFSATIVFDSGTNKLTFSATRSTGAKSSTTINFIQK